jgi:hypothetical protein
MGEYVVDVKLRELKRQMSFIQQKLEYARKNVIYITHNEWIKHRCQGLRNLRKAFNLLGYCRLVSGAFGA